MNRQRKVGEKVSDAFSNVSEAAQEVGSEAKDAAASLAADANEAVKGAVKGIANHQVGAGADLVGHVAQSVRSAADDLDQNVPQLAGLVRGAADKLEDFEDTIRDQTVEELFERTSDFARRKPIVLFSAAAACGFFLFRLLKASPSDRLRTSRGRQFAARASKAASRAGPAGRARGRGQSRAG